MDGLSDDIYAALEKPQQQQAKPQSKIAAGDDRLSVFQDAYDSEQDPANKAALGNVISKMKGTSTAQPAPVQQASPSSDDGKIPPQFDVDAVTSALERPKNAHDNSYRVEISGVGSKGEPDSTPDKSQIAKQVIGTALLNHPLAALAEGAANNISGMLAKPISDIAGLAATGYSALTGDKDGDPAGFKNYVQDSLTYQPRGAAGQAVAEYNPIAMAGKGWGLIGDAAGNYIKGDNPGEIRQGIGNAVAEAIPQAVGLLGAKAATPAGKAPNGISGAISDAARVEPTLVKPQYKIVDGKIVQVDPVAATSENSTPINQSAGRIEPGMNNQGNLQSVGAAAAKLSDQAIASGASPEIISEIKLAEKKGGANALAASRHAEASSLDVPISMTAGEAMGDSALISWEKNNRGKYPQIGNLIDARNDQFIQNFDAIRQRVAPDIGNGKTNLDQMAVDAYKKMDEPARADVKAAYDALASENNGKLPVDGKAFVDNVDSKIGVNKLVDRSENLPSSVMKTLKKIRDSAQQMTFDDYEDFGSLISQETRKARHTQDRAMVRSLEIVRDELENMPMSSDAENLKPLLNSARAKAKARFDAIRSDPAYDAAINDGIPRGEPSPEADGFMNKYAFRSAAKTSNVINMVKNLSNDPLNKQILSAGLIDNIKDRSGIDLRTNTGNFSQSGLNNSIGDLDLKKRIILGDYDSGKIDTLGNVGMWTDKQSKGQTVNNSGTLSGGLANGAMNDAKELGLAAANIQTLGVLNYVRGKMAKRAEEKAVEKSIKQGAGIRISDFPK